MIRYLLAALLLSTPGYAQTGNLSGASVTATTTGQTNTLADWFQGISISGGVRTQGGPLLINLGSVAQTSIAGRVLGLTAADGANTNMILDASGVFPRYIGRRVNGTFASPTAIAANDVLIGFEGRGYDGSAFTVSHAGIDFSAAQAWTTGARGGKITFKTTANNATSAAAAKMTLENTGALLIGTTTDNAVDKLQVNGGSRANYLATGAGTLTLTTGAVGLSKMTASASAPGAAGGKLELVCGTNAGTAKLVAYAGTSGTAVTVLDNIGAGVTGC